MTPIDWKLVEIVNLPARELDGHHSLVTPIDWKPVERQTQWGELFGGVTTRW